jgi:hypothetical protein
MAKATIDSMHLLSRWLCKLVVVERRMDGEIVIIS